MKSKLYRCDVMLYATAYVRADSKKEARKILESMAGTPLEFDDDQWLNDDLRVDGRRFDDPELPNRSLSPAMTFAGAANDGYSDLEEAE